MPRCEQTTDKLQRAPVCAQASVLPAHSIKAAPMPTIARPLSSARLAPLGHATQSLANRTDPATMNVLKTTKSHEPGVGPPLAL